MLSLVEIGSVVLEKKIFYILSIYFSLFLNYLRLEKDGALHLNKVESSLVEIGQVVLEKKWKIGKVYRRMDRLTDRQTTD